MDDFDGYVVAAWPRLLRSAWLLTGDWHQAEDILQTALVKTYGRWRRVRPGSADAYVRKVMATTYLSWWRRRWRLEVPTAQPPDQSGTEDPAVKVDVRLAVAAALSRLPRGQRAVLMLRYHADLTEAATAKALGVSVGTVKSQAARAFGTLRAQPELRALFVSEDM
jgi:RNA polymerase sigma-70 factor (sigma-E family)